MKKPDRKAFAREYGPRGAAKYATAMRKYRKYLKTKPTAPPPPPGKTKGIGPIKDGAKYARQVANSKTKTTGVGPVKSGAEYGRALTKGKSAQPASSAKAKPAVKAKPKQDTGSFFDGAKGGKYDKKEPTNTRAKRQPGSTGGRGGSNTPKRRKNRRGSGMRISDYRLF